MEKEIKKLEQMIKESYNYEDILTQSKIIDNDIDKIIRESI